MCTLDLADLASVQKAGEALAASLPRLDILCLNAGVMAVRGTCGCVASAAALAAHP